MSYELRALVGARKDLETAAKTTGTYVVHVAQGFGLLPLTNEVLDRLGEGESKLFGTHFSFMSEGLLTLAAQASSTGPVAYLEADFWGDLGTQAALVLQEGRLVLGPVRTRLGFSPPDPPRSEWAFNQALRRLGVERGKAIDEFEGLGLGAHRRTENWTPGHPSS